MRKVPKGALMNQKEFEQFVFDLNNFGFDLDPEIVPQKHDETFGIFADTGEQVLSKLLHYDKIYGQLLDYINGYRTEKVYCDGVEITASNLAEYKELLEYQVEGNYQLLDDKLLLFKQEIGLIPFA